VNNAAKVAVVLALAAAVGAVIYLKAEQQTPANGNETRPHTATNENEPTSTPEQEAATPKKAIPRLLDLGAGKCIPCKLMAPILEELKKEYDGRFDVVFIDVWINPEPARKHKIRLIPTQIFFDASGKELFRHEGFYSKKDILGKWKELGYDFASAAALAFERLEPGKPDTRPKDKVCYMCDGDVGPRTRVLVKTGKGEVQLCGPHCYFIMYSCLTEDKTDFEKRVSVTDWPTGKLLRATEAAYLYDLDEKTGRPQVKAFADKDSALEERRAAGGSLIGWDTLQNRELATRCGYCDRAVYPEDAALVKAGGVHTWGCCSHCALGVAARTGKDIEVHQPDRLTGEMIVVKTLDGRVASLEPRAAVAWFGRRKKPDGKWGSAGCFHQGFFVNPENLKKWVEQHPYETGKLISIQKALSNKMKLTPGQISKACKIGECAPK